jgi:hypothetical protein
MLNDGCLLSFFLLFSIFFFSIYFTKLRFSSHITYCNIYTLYDIIGEKKVFFSIHYPVFEFFLSL